jgi:multicomponent Na+:H+ antiporter subunit F
MNVWLACAAILLVALVPCGWVCLRGDPVRRLVGLELAGVVVALELELLAQATHRAYLYDLALAQSVLTLGGALVFARFLERWL